MRRLVPVPNLLTGSNSNRRYTMSIALSPERMSAAERLDEVAEILAAGARRLMSRKSSRISADGGDSSVDLTAHQSVYGEATKRRVSRR